MKRAAILLILLLAMAAQAQQTSPRDTPIVTSDIDLFWNAYDKAKPENDLIVYRDEYLKKGSTGLAEFTRLRIGSVCDLVETIGAHPAYYRGLRKDSLRIKTFEPAIRASFERLADIYPDAVFPPVYFVIGRMNSAGTLSDKGLLIGVDMFGMTPATDLSELSDWHKAVLSSVDRLPYIVAHELIHYQQAAAPDRTLLSAAVREGSADFIGELISGGQINPHLHRYGDPIEKDLWLEFAKEMEGTDRSNWLYQGDNAKERPADLGYYIGYKIAESYYDRTPDKALAVKEILNISDTRKFLEASKYADKFRDR